LACACGGQNPLLFFRERAGKIGVPIHKYETVGSDTLQDQLAPANQKFVDDYNNARRIVDTTASHANPTPPTPAPQSKPKA
jgi:hypothetical protein